MDRIRIVGGNALNGGIPISGAKNAALPLMIASLLTDDTLTLENVPHLADVEQLIRILGNHGVDYSVQAAAARSENEGYPRTINFSARNIVDTTAPYELVSKMRASFWVIGPLLARMGESRKSRCRAAAPSARGRSTCSSKACRRSAPHIDVDTGYVVASAKNGRLSGNRYVFPKVSVGATHVLMMAASLAARRDGARKRRLRARDRQSGRMPQRDGRQDLRRRHANHHHRRRRLAVRRRVTASSPTASRPAPMRWRSP